MFALLPFFLLVPLFFVSSLVASWPVAVQGHHPLHRRRFVADTDASIQLRLNKWTIYTPQLLSDVRTLLLLPSSFVNGGTLGFGFTWIEG